MAHFYKRRKWGILYFGYIGDPLLPVEGSSRYFLNLNLSDLSNRRFRFQGNAARHHLDAPDRDLRRRGRQHPGNVQHAEVLLPALPTSLKRQNRPRNGGVEVYRFPERHESRTRRCSAHDDLLITLQRVQEQRAASHCSRKFRVLLWRSSIVKEVNHFSKFWLVQVRHKGALKYFLSTGRKM